MAESVGEVIGIDAEMRTDAKTFLDFFLFLKVFYFGQSYGKLGVMRVVTSH